MSEVNHLEMAAIDFAVQVMNCTNDIQQDNFMSTHGLEKREKILVFSTGFVMTYLGRTVKQELPPYAASFFWAAVSGGVYDKHSTSHSRAAGTKTEIFEPPQSSNVERIQREVVRRSPDAFIRLEKVKGQKHPIFVATQVNGNSHSNPDLDSLMDEIGMSVEQLENDGAEIYL